MPDGKGKTGYRLCVTVAMEPFMQLHNASAVRDACSRCGEPVWVSMAQELPADAPEEVLCICLACALGDEALRPLIQRSLIPAVIEYRMTGKTRRL